VHEERWIAHLADLLGADVSEARAWLQARLNALKGELEEAGQAIWPGVGRFFRLPDGRIGFEPEEELARAVNERYEGLVPILAPDSWEEPEEEGELEEEGEAEEVVVKEKEAPTEETGVENSSGPEEQSPGWGQNVVEPEEPPQPVLPAEEEYTPISWEPTPSPEPPFRPKPRPAEPRPPSALVNPERIRSRPRSAVPMLWLLGVLFVAGVAAVVWYFRREYYGLGPELASSPVPSQPQRAMELFSPDTTAQTSGPDTLQVTAEAPAVPAPVPAPASGPAWWRQPVNPDQEGWTLVLASWPTEPEARADQEQLRTYGVEATVVPAQTPIGRRFRLVVGQFPSRQEAEAQREELARRLGRPDVWVLRLTR
jgi:hypothetical protein